MKKIPGFYVCFNSQTFRIRLFLTIILKTMQCILCIISCFNDQTYALIPYASWFSTNRSKFFSKSVYTSRLGIFLDYGRTAYPTVQPSPTVNFLFHPISLLICNISLSEKSFQHQTQLQEPYLYV